MRKLVLKTALLVLAAAGVLSISSCEKGEENQVITEKSGEFLADSWRCTDYRYTQTGSLLLSFKEGIITGTNSTGQESIFDSLNSSYVYSGDYLYIGGVKADSITVISSNEIKITFLGGILQYGGCPSGEYNFSRVGGVK